MGKGMWFLGVLGAFVRKVGRGKELKFWTGKVPKLDRQSYKVGRGKILKLDAAKF